MPDSHHTDAYEQVAGGALHTIHSERKRPGKDKGGHKPARSKTQKLQRRPTKVNLSDVEAAEQKLWDKHKKAENKEKEKEQKRQDKEAKKERATQLKKEQKEEKERAALAKKAGKSAAKDQDQQSASSHAGFGDGFGDGFGGGFIEQESDTSTGPRAPEGTVVYSEGATEKDDEFGFGLEIDDTGARQAAEEKARDVLRAEALARRQLTLIEEQQALSKRNYPSVSTVVQAGPTVFDHNHLINQALVKHQHQHQPQHQYQHQHQQVMAQQAAAKGGLSHSSPLYSVPTANEVPKMSVVQQEESLLKQQQALAAQKESLDRQKALTATSPASGSQDALFGHLSLEDKRAQRELALNDKLRAAELAVVEMRSKEKERELEQRLKDAENALQQMRFGPSAQNTPGYQPAGSVEDELQALLSLPKYSQSTAHNFNSTRSSLVETPRSSTSSFRTPMSQHDDLAALLMPPSELSPQPAAPWLVGLDPTVHVSQNTSQQKCAYASARGDCLTTAPSGQMYCDNHKCPTASCKNSKSSRDDTCAACGEDVYGGGNYALATAPEPTPPPSTGTPSQYSDDGSQSKGLYSFPVKPSMRKATSSPEQRRAHSSQHKESSERASEPEKHHRHSSRERDSRRASDRNREPRQRSQSSQRYHEEAYSDDESTGSHRSSSRFTPQQSKHQGAFLAVPGKSPGNSRKQRSHRSSSSANKSSHGGSQSFNSYQDVTPAARFDERKRQSVRGSSVRASSVRNGQQSSGTPPGHSRMMQTGPQSLSSPLGMQPSFRAGPPQPTMMGAGPQLMMPPPQGMGQPSPMMMGGGPPPMMPPPQGMGMMMRGGSIMMGGGPQPMMPPQGMGQPRPMMMGGGPPPMMPPQGMGPPIMFPQQGLQPRPAF